MIAYSYLRISTPEQRKGRGPMRQLDETSRYCEQQGLELNPKTLKDLGVSGYDGSNVTKGALGGFLQGISDGTISTPCALVIEALDRLTRAQCEDAVYLLLGLVRAGVEVHTVVDRMVYRTGKIPMHQMMYSVMVLSTGHLESDRKSGLLKKSWIYKREDARKSGKPMTRLMPEWLTLIEGKIVLVPERAALVERIFQEAANGSGKLAIAGRFNEERIEPWGRKKKKGVRWHYSYIHKILTNRAVLGECQLHRMVEGKRTPEGEPLLNFFPPVVTQELWDAARKSMSSRSVRHDANPDAPRNLVPGLVYIDGVRANWVNKGKRTTSDGQRRTKKPHPLGGWWVYYQTLKPESGAKMAVIPAMGIEEMILSALRKADGEEWQKLIKKAAPEVDPKRLKREQLKVSIKRAEDSLERLVGALALGVGGAATITAKIAAEELALGKAKKQLSKLGPDVPVESRFAAQLNDLQNLAADGDVTHPEIRAALGARIKDLFERIDIGRTPKAMLEEKRKSKDATPFVLAPGLLERPAAVSMEDQDFFWALLTPSMAPGVRLMVMSHAFDPAVLALLKARAEIPLKGHKSGR